MAPGGGGALESPIAGKKTEGFLRAHVEVTDAARAQTIADLFSAKVAEFASPGKAEIAPYWKVEGQQIVYLPFQAPRAVPVAQLAKLLEELVGDAGRGRLEGDTFDARLELEVGTYQGLVSELRGLQLLVKLPGANTRFARGDVVTVRELEKKGVVTDVEVDQGGVSYIVALEGSDEVLDAEESELSRK